MKRTNITLTEQLKIELKVLSEKTGLTVSDLIRRGVELLIREYKKEDK